jgi:hypothetical protein
VRTLQAGSSGILKAFMGMSSSLVDSRSPLPWSSNSVARPLFGPFLENFKKIRLSIFPVAQVFVGPLSSYVAEILIHLFKSATFY